MRAGWDFRHLLVAQNWAFPLSADVKTNIAL
jgi:hypothetical protein